MDEEEADKEENLLRRQIALRLLVDPLVDRQSLSASGQLRHHCAGRRRRRTQPHVSTGRRRNKGRGEAPSTQEECIEDEDCSEAAVGAACHLVCCNVGAIYLENWMSEGASS